MREKYQALKVEFCKKEEELVKLRMEFKTLKEQKAEPLKENNISPLQRRVRSTTQDLVAINSQKISNPNKGFEEKKIWEKNSKREADIETEFKPPNMNVRPSSNPNKNAPDASSISIPNSISRPERKNHLKK